MGNLGRAWLITCVLLSASTTLAQDRAAARAAFEGGVSAYGEGRYEVALESFQEAYRIAPHPSVRVNMANCYEQLNRPVEALNHFERFLIESENPSDQQRAEVRAAIERLQQRIGEVFVRGVPDGASVTLDGATTMRAPILDGIKLIAGSHTVRVENAGFEPYEHTFELQGGQREELTIELQPAVVAPVEVQEPEEVEESDGFHLPTPVWITAGAAVALGIGAAVSGITALSANSDFDSAVSASNDPNLSSAERAQARADGLDAKDRADRRALTADILGIAALASAGTAVVLYFVLDDDDEDAATASLLVSPAVGQNAAGVQLQGAF